ncbi:hypothetical protein TNCV_1716331 [Trichonephila clavipes]|nr:hypothetical protein TNCV_1716331 [Trichonephila clavipes]
MHGVSWGEKSLFQLYHIISRNCSLETKYLGRLLKDSITNICDYLPRLLACFIDNNGSKSGIHRIQCIKAGDRHVRRAGMSYQQPGQTSGRILPRSHVRWLDESRQPPCFSPGASGLDT